VIVIDASAVIDLLLNLAPRADTVRQRIIEVAPGISAPHLLDAEVGQVLRHYVLRGDITPHYANAALTDLLDLPITRYPHGPLLSRAFEMRDNVTIYDALYLVLAEGLNATLLTSDAALAKMPGHHARVELTG